MARVASASLPWLVKRPAAMIFLRNGFFNGAFRDFCCSATKLGYTFAGDSAGAPPLRSRIGLFRARRTACRERLVERAGAQRCGDPGDIARDVARLLLHRCVAVEGLVAGRVRLVV